MFSSIETRIQYGPPTNPTLTETTKSTLHSDETPPPYCPPELITFPIILLLQLQRCTDENVLLKEQIQDLAAEIEAVKMFMKEKLHLLEKAQKDKSDEEDHSNKNAELVQLLHQQKASLLEENASKKS